MKRRLIFAAAMLLLTSCTYTNAVTLTNIPSERSKVVTASVKKHIFLGFNFDNDQVLKLTSALQEKCPNGSVKGVLTKDYTTLYFLFFFWARETEVSGYCVPNRSVAAGPGVNESIEVSQWEAAGDVAQ